MEENNGLTTMTNPTYFGVVCPNCGADDWSNLRAKGSYKSQLGGGDLRNTGAKQSGDGKLILPLNARCRQCHHKFMSEPIEAQPEEVLSTPAVLHFTRQKAFSGALQVNQLLVNGAFYDPIRNGESMDIPLYTKHVYIQLFDASGNGSGANERFEVAPGETVDRTVKIKPRWV